MGETMRPDVMDFRGPVSRPRPFHRAGPEVASHRRVMLRRATCNRDGSVVALYALAMSMLILCVGLSLDVGYVYSQKGAGQITSDIAALCVLGSLDRTLTPEQQVQYVNDQVRHFETANGLPAGFWTIRTVTRGDGDIVQLTLNATNPLPTMIMNLAGIERVNVGLESVVVRGFLRQVAAPNCPGNLGLFGCARLQIRGNPLIDSYRSDLGTYASQAVHTGCGTSMGGHENHLGEGGHEGHGEAVYANRNLLGGSNRLVDMNGSFCYHGDSTSGLDTSLAGAGRLDGSVTTEYFTGDTAIVANQILTQSVSEINLATAVGAATASSNDNATLVGHDPVAIASPDFRLKAEGGSHEVQLQAGKKYYFKDIDLSGAVTVRITGNPDSAGPVEIALDGDAKFAGDLTCDVLPMRPGWLKIVGVNGTTECCEGCRTSGTGHRGGHGHHDGEVESGTEVEHHIKFTGNSTIFADIYAPGFHIDTTGVSQYYGRIIGEDVQIQGNSGFHYDETLGGCLSIVQDDIAEDGERIHLVN